MSLDERFAAACTKAKAYSKKPSDDELLEFYGLYKQATDGDNNAAKPGVLDLKAKAKWQRWADKAGMSKDAAKEAYIKLTEETSKYV